jgi:hypothetical protein
MPLTPALIRAALPRDRLYTLSDGGGMLLQVTPQGHKRWRLRYRYRGIPNTISLGLYPEVGSRAAREQRAEARGLLALGFNPSVRFSNSSVSSAAMSGSAGRDRKPAMPTQAPWKLEKPPSAIQVATFSPLPPSPTKTSCRLGDQGRLKRLRARGKSWGAVKRSVSCDDDAPSYNMVGARVPCDGTLRRQAN